MIASRMIAWIYRVVLRRPDLTARALERDATLAEIRMATHEIIGGEGQTERARARLRDDVERLNAAVRDASASRR